MKYIFFLIFFVSLTAAAQSQLPSPREYFGFTMGTEKKMIDWPQIVSYSKLAAEKSPRVQVTELGKTTLGKPFILVTLSTEKNMKNLERLRAIQKMIAFPDGITKLQDSALVREGKTVVFIGMNIHSGEIASSQQSVELIYDYATSQDAAIVKMLDDVVFLLVPSLNPDGLQMVVEWYRKTLGTSAEGSMPPMLYHYYAGHDNNRDWFMYNLAESRLVAKVLYEDWYPEIVYDQHQMGTNNARFFLPPYEDPVNPNIDPRLSSEMNLLGEYIVADLHKQGLKGVVTGTTFTGYFPGTLSKTPMWHNRIGILSEAASSYLATPIFLPRGSVRGMGQFLSANIAQSNHLDPFERGWWSLRNIIDYEKYAVGSMLEFASVRKEKIKMNFLTLNREAIAAENTFTPAGWMIPVNQHDPNAAFEMVRRLAVSGVKIKKISEPFPYQGRTIAEGSWWITAAQPSRSYVKDLFEIQHYPDLKQYPGGPPRAPYDITAWTWPMQMGVEVVVCNETPKIVTVPADSITLPSGITGTAGTFYVLERRWNTAYAIMNALSKKNISVFETLYNGIVSAGTFLIPAKKADRKFMDETAKKWNVQITCMDISDTTSMRAALPARIGLYQSWRSSVDEGWTRYLFDQYGIAYTILKNVDMKKKGEDLKKDFDVIILPDMSANMIVDGKNDEDDDDPVDGIPVRPKEFQGGIGKEGVESMKEFIRTGGSLLTFASASNFAIEKIRIPAVNLLKGVASKDFYASGSILEITLDTNHPLTYGMNSTAFIYFTNDPVFRLLQTSRQSASVGWYENTNPLRSGWLIGEDYVEGKTAFAEIPFGNGKVIMYGFGVQHRAQTHGTYKLLLNALIVRK